ncbi:hypothetical protein [Jannaschia sp. R86511]|uniref:hypothetical protein n=1 Tax=Jannaschia sp. R86511 TaxID=3093853 RepID=UPI0036D350B9
MNEPGAPQDHDDELVRRLRLLDPVDTDHVSGVTRQGREGIADRLGPASVRPVTGGRHGAPVLLLAAALAGLLTLSTVALGAGGQRLSSVAAQVTGLLVPDRVDRWVEATRHEAWVDEVVTCLQDEYGDAVVPAEGGYTVSWSQLPTATDGTRSFGDLLCRWEAGDPPRPSPLSDAELERHHGAQVELAACLRDLGHDVGEAPSPAEFATSWRDPAPEAPPWTPYRDLDVVDGMAAQQACGVPSAPAPPAYGVGSEPVLDQGFSDPFGAGGAVAVGFAGSPTEQLRLTEECVLDLLASDEGGLDAAPADGDLAYRGYCQGRHPLSPDVPQPSAQEHYERVHAWTVEQSVPCLRSHGVQVPTPPTFGEFLRSADDGGLWSPWQFVTAEQLGDRAEADALQRVCPRDPPDTELTD